MEGACRPALGEYLQYNGSCYALTEQRIPYQVEIVETSAFPQDYAAAMTVYQRIAEFNKVITVDIGDFTLDYLMIRGEKTDFVEDVVRIVEDMTRTFVNDILGTLRERGLG